MESRDVVLPDLFFEPRHLETSVILPIPDTRKKHTHSASLNPCQPRHLSGEPPCFLLSLQVHIIANGIIKIYALKNNT